MNEQNGAARPGPQPARGGSGDGGGELPSYQDFVAEHRPRMLRTAITLVGHRRYAEDLLQNALARASQRWDEVSTCNYPQLWIHAFNERGFSALDPKRSGDARGRSRSTSVNGSA